MPSLVLQDHCSESDTFFADVVGGLSLKQKSIPSKYLYDQRGSQLFDEICELPKYYPTRTEIGIMQRSGAQMADAISSRALVLEYGSGSSIKTHLLLQHLDDPVGYVPIDISREHLIAAAERVAEDFPVLEVIPVCADYTRDFPVPDPSRTPSRRVVYFPGSTIGNFTPDRVASFLHHISETADALLIGVDLIKEISVLEAAYDDEQGVTAAFNLNLLHRINRELGGDFDPGSFQHRAVFNRDASRIEMHLVSRKKQTVSVAGRPFTFEQGESICTEYSYKYEINDFAQIARGAKLDLQALWTDEQSYFSIQLYSSAGSGA